MTSRPLDDPAILSAMKAYLDACAAVDAASNDIDVLDKAEAKSMAGLALRKRLAEAGWAAPTRQRTTT